MWGEGARVSVEGMDEHGNKKQKTKNQKQKTGVVLHSYTVRKMMK